MLFSAHCCHIQMQTRKGLLYSHSISVRKVHYDYHAKLEGKSIVLVLVKNNAYLHYLLHWHLHLAFYNHAHCQSAIEMAEIEMSYCVLSFQ